MNAIPVVKLNPGEQWDQNMLDLLFTNKLYPTGLNFEFREDYPGADGIILIVPGRYWHAKTDEITEHLQPYKWVLAIRTGDEEDLFDISKVEHPNIEWWVQTPRTDRDYDDARLFGVGFPPHFNGLQPDTGKPLDLFFAGQVTHDRRAKAFAAIPDEGLNKRVLATPGFTQGLSPVDYAESMIDAKVAPAPSGAFSPDSFRLYEALEAHCVPIADDISPVYDSRGYWQMLFSDAPFPILEDYESLPGYIDEALKDWPRNANRIATWWMFTKRQMAVWIREDLEILGANVGGAEQERLPITVIITTSPIKSHPDTRIIDETVASVRKQLPDAEIIMTFDGVRPEHEDRRSDYEEHIRRVLWKADHEWKNVLPLIFDEHLHQALCTRRALVFVRTPLMLFVEGDTPLTDAPIEWAGLCQNVLSGNAHMIRFHHESQILDVHKHLMLDQEAQTTEGVRLTRTVQYSQRPHLASTAFYREMLDRYFPNNEKNFIEDVVYGKLIEAYARDREMGWLNWRLWMYTPEGNIQRSYHTDGREGEDKFDR